MKTPPSSRADRLRARLNDRVRATGDRALENGAAVSDAELEELERLSRLVRLAEAAEPTPRKRWPLGVALGATLLVTSLLLFVRVPSTEIELDLTTSEARFVVPSPQVLTELVNVASVGVTGATSVQLPRPLVAPAADPPDGGLAVRMAAAGGGTRTGSVTVSALTIPARTRVGVRVHDAARGYRLSLRGAGAAVRVGVLGPVAVSVAGQPAGQVDFPAPRPVVLGADGTELLIDLAPSDTPPAFSPLLPVTQLALDRVDDYQDGDRSVVRRVSAIRSGTLYLESLDGAERPLRAGQRLTFGAIDGEIRTLRLAGDHVALQFHGRVRAMRTGVGAAERSLMPTVLEWLYARHGASLLWGTTLYVFGLLVTIQRWWKGGS